MSEQVIISNMVRVTDYYSGIFTCVTHSRDRASVSTGALMFLENGMNQQRPWLVAEEERCNPCEC
jgi:hypothetical protein